MATAFFRIIDYPRSPDTTDSAAIDPIFETTEIKNEGGKKDYAHYWTSSSHPSTRGAETAVYFAFDRSLGFMKDRRTGETTLMDVHGADSQRSDPKVGDASNYPYGRGPQDDVIRIENMVRCVRGGDVETVASGPEIEKKRQHASSGQKLPHEGGFMEHEDRNGDGKVSRDEFQGSAEHFDHLDKDGNGVITENEAPAGPPPNRR